MFNSFKELEGGVLNRKWIFKSRNDYEFHGHAIKEYLVSKQTQFQFVEIVDTYNYGKVLILDGVPQSSEYDEFIYHEALVHPVLCAHSNPKDVLIIGGGEGAVLREVLKHAFVEHVSMVDIDKELIDICRQYLTSWHCYSFDNSRAKIFFEDGRQYLRSHKHAFDCIILDLSDPFEGSPANGLFTFEFYNLVKEALKGDGVISLQAESGALLHSDAHRRIVHTLSSVFQNVFPYYVHVPLYATYYGFVICGNENLTKESLVSDKITNILSDRKVHDLRFYDAETARGLFSIPLYLRQRNDRGVKSITDSDPLMLLP